MTTASRTIDAVQIPRAGTYALDASHSHVGFTARHLVVAKVRGRFGAFSGAVVVAEEPAASTVTVSIEAASIDTGDAARDAHLRSDDFLDVDRHPTITFASTGVHHVAGERWAVEGDLTVRGVTRPVTLDVTLDGVATDPWGGERAAFAATTEIDREEFGLTWNQALEGGGVLVGRKVKLEIEAEAVRQP